MKIFGRARAGFSRRTPIALLLAAALLLSVTACSKNKDGNNIENTDSEDDASAEPPSGDTAAVVDYREVDLKREDLDDDKFREMVDGNEVPADTTVLYLTFNQITDISPLAKLTKLKSLLASGGEGSNQISDLTPLSGLTSLEELQLSINPITDVSPLASLNGNLTYLALAYCGVLSDISPLAELKSLQYLYLMDNQITDISALSELTNLLILDISGNEIDEADVDALKAALPNCKVIFNDAESSANASASDGDEDGEAEESEEE